jgi:hypothetical protein
MVENWDDDVPEGKVTDFHRSMQKCFKLVVGQTGSFLCMGGGFRIA